MRTETLIKSDTLPTHYLHVLLELTSERGIQSDAVLEGTGLTQAMVENPETKITLKQFKTLAKNALRLTNDPALGLHLGKKLSISSHGYLGIAVMSSKNFEEALHTAIKFAKTRTPFIKASFFVEDDMAVIRIKPSLLIGELYPTIIEIVFNCLKLPTRNAKSG